VVFGGNDPNRTSGGDYQNGTGSFLRHQGDGAGQYGFSFVLEPESPDHGVIDETTEERDAVSEA
jgi:hypothetical protein